VAVASRGERRTRAKAGHPLLAFGESPKSALDRQPRIHGRSETRGCRDRNSSRASHQFRKLKKTECELNFSRES
jgi:hypothetical protein